MIGSLNYIQLIELCVMWENSDSKCGLVAANVTACETIVLRKMMFES